MKTSLDNSALEDLSAKVREANQAFSQKYPGETGQRQPVHTVYGGAHLFKSDSAERLGGLARRSLDQFAPDFLTFAKAVGLPGADELPVSLEQDAKLAALIEANLDGVRRSEDTRLNSSHSQIPYAVFCLKKKI